MTSWFDTPEFKENWHKFFLLADQTMMKLPMRGWEPQWNRSKFPGGLAGMTERLIMLQKSFYHLLLKYAYSLSADLLLRESTEERERRFWENERLYHFHDFFPRYRSFLDYAARFVAPLFDWTVLDDHQKERNLVYFESVRNNAKILIGRTDVVEFEFISQQDAARLCTFLDKMDVRTSCSGDEQRKIQEAVWGIRNQLIHESLLTTAGSLWGLVKHSPPKPPKMGRSEEEETETFKIGFPNPTFNDLQSYAYKILSVIAEAFDELKGGEFLQEHIDES